MEAQRGSGVVAVLP